MAIDSNVKIKIRTGPMRELRKNITFKELNENGITPDQVHSLYRQYGYGGVATEGIPDSFYEQPMEGSFGNFGSGVWGYLADIDMSLNRPYVCVGGACYASFTPGLPEDVDADGMPK